MTTPAVEAFRPRYSPDEINTGEPTRTARLKWVIVVNADLTAGLMVNAVACVAASTGTLFGPRQRRRARRLRAPAPRAPLGRM